MRRGIFEDNTTLERRGFEDRTVGRCEDIKIQGYSNHYFNPPRSTCQCRSCRHSKGVRRPDRQRPSRAQGWICLVHNKDQRDTEETKDQCKWLGDEPQVTIRGQLEHRSTALKSFPILRKISAGSSTSQISQRSKEVVKCKNWICGAQATWTAEFGELRPCVIVMGFWDLWGFRPIALQRCDLRAHYKCRTYYKGKIHPQYI